MGTCFLVRFAVARNIGLFGGTFDPPHLGHLIIAQSLVEQVPLDRMVFVPSGHPPHKQDRVLTAGDYRIRMLELALADNPAFSISDWELHQASLTYTIHSVRHYHEEYPDAQLFWIIGADNLADLPTWHQFDRLIEEVQIVTAWRGGFDIDRVLAGLRPQLTEAQFERLRTRVVRTPQIEICAQDLRTRVRAGLTLRYHVPPAVENYIRREGLYR